MFGKKVKIIREMNREVEILDKRIVREVKKLNEGIIQEIKKGLKKVVPGIQVKIDKLTIHDFIEHKKRSVPLSIFIDSLNGKHIHVSGVWVEIDQESGLQFKTDNRIDVDHFEQICSELSENLGVFVQTKKVTGLFR